MVPRSRELLTPTWPSRRPRPPWRCKAMVQARLDLRVEHFVLERIAQRCPPARLPELPALHSEPESGRTLGTFPRQFESCRPDSRACGHWSTSWRAPARSGAGRRKLQVRRGAIHEHGEPGRVTLGPLQEGNVLFRPALLHITAEQLRRARQQFLPPFGEVRRSVPALHLSPITPGGIFR